MSKKRRKPWSVFIAIFLAMVFGTLAGKDATLFNISLFRTFDVLGIIFLNALTLVVVPLVSSSIISGISRMGQEGVFGRLGLKMFLFYFVTSLLAILTGLFFVNLLQPGVGYATTATTSLPVEQLSALREHMHQNQGEALVQLLLQIVPSNVLFAFSQGQMLGLIFFSLLFGYALSKVSPKPFEIVHGFFQGIFQAMIETTHIVMKFLPIGVFCLVAKVFMAGVSSITSLALFLSTVLLGLAFFMFVCLPVLLRLVARVNPLRHFKAMAPALVTAFSTSSTSATLPITIDCTEKRAGVSNRICSLVVPLGTSINLSGSALYECVAAMFVAQAYGLDLSFAVQFIVVFMALITSIGVAGIPSASLVAILVILRTLGLPPEGLGLFIAVDRLLDMCRTTVNVFSDSCCAVLVAKSEGETNVLATDPVDE